MSILNKNVNILNKKVKLEYYIITIDGNDVRKI